MTENAAKNFRVPKIKRQESKDNLRQVDLNSRDALEIVNIIKHSFLESNFQPIWELKSVHFIENRELEERYRQKKMALKDAKVPVVDQYAFTLCRDNSPIVGIVKQGFRCKPLSVNSLGDSKLGVYVCKNADVQLKLADVWSISSCYLMVFKVTLGKCKAVPGQVGEEMIEPTPNYDCHIHQLQPKPSDTFSQQLSRSQIYLYEYTEDCEPSPVPRQCLPYAVLLYEKSDVAKQPIYKTPTDSYSRRPSNTKEISRLDSTDIDSVQKSDPRLRKDPRKTSTETRQPLPEPKSFNPADPRLAYQQLEQTGSLCVPRLTPGPPPSDPRIPTAHGSRDPRVNSQVFDPRLPPPIATDQPVSASLVPQPVMMPGMPPPIDPSRFSNPFRPNDPFVQSLAPPVPRDPRLASGQDPDNLYQPSFGPSEEQLQLTRLELLKQINSALPPHARKDPRLKTGEDPRNRDPRLLREDTKSKDPRSDQKEQQDEDFRYRDPRLRRESRNTKSSLKDTESSSSRERKKLSIHEYKKKVSIQPAGKIECNTDIATMISTDQPAIASADQPAVAITDQSASIYDSLKANNSHQLKISDSREPYSTAENSENLILIQERATFRDGEEEYQPFDSEYLEENMQKDIEEDAVLEEIVHKPDDMARTLNELSDPDDESRSPQENFESNDEDDDPALAEAMKKLVEYTSDVPLFTEALRSLQESAEEYGDSLTNPVFLVKKIAEYIDHLAKDKENKKSDGNVNEEPVQINDGVEDTVKNQELKEPVELTESIKSPDGMDISSDRSVECESGLVPEIPLENTESSTKDNDVLLSPMSKAMQKTLEAYESAPTETFTGEVFTYSNEKQPNTAQSIESKEPNLKISKSEVISGRLNMTQSNIDPSSIPLPTSSKQSTLKEREHKKAYKSNFSFNFKKRHVSADRVANIFKDDSDAEIGDQDERKAKKMKSQKYIPSKISTGRTVTSEIADFGTEDKDMRNIVRSEAALDRDFRRGKMVTSVTVDITNVSERPPKDVPLYTSSKLKNVDKSRSTFDMFEEPMLDKDERICRDRDRPGKSSIVQHLDPSFLDKDERQSKLGTGSGQVLNPAFMDVDERSNSSTAFNETFKNTMEDKDERLRSRSQSPSVVDGSQSKETVLTTTVKNENPVTDSQSSSEDSGALFDAYAVEKTSEKIVAEQKSDDKIVGNNYGDVDWRVSAAAEMGDVDLRSSHSSMSQMSGDVDMRAALEQTPRYTSNTQYSYYTSSGQSSAYTQDTHVGKYHHEAVTDVYSSYTTSKTAYNAYTTSQGRLPTYYGEYKTSGSVQNQGSSLGSFPQSMSTIDAKQDNMQPGNLQNLIQNVDFSNLKNILANVQSSPVTSSDGDMKPSGADSDIVDVEDDSQNKPAFCTGLSFLKSKQPRIDLTRAKYTGVAKVPSDVGPPPVRPPVPVPPPVVRPQMPIVPSVNSGPKSLLDIPMPSRPPKFDSPSKSQKSLFDSPLFESSASNFTRSGIIPGFEDPTESATDVFDDTKSDIPDSESPEKTGKTKQPFKFSEEIPDRDFSSEWYDNSYGVKQEQKPDSKINDDKYNRSKTESSKSDKQRHDSDSRDSKKKGSDTPTKSKHNKKGETSTPKYESSWQTAILESMEESALKVRHDDSYTADTLESPVKEPECTKRLFETDKKEFTEDHDSKKRKTEDVEEDTRKVQKVQVHDLDPESDEESALVIDLTADTKSRKDSVSETVTKQVIDLTDASSLRKDSVSETVAKTVTDLTTKTSVLETVAAPVIDRTANTRKGSISETVPDNTAKLDKDDDLAEDNEVEAGEILEDDDVIPTKSDEMKTLIEKSRKNMVIRLKGETKIVNPKTGKAYNESPSGSAIEVVGQSRQLKSALKHPNTKPPLSVSNKPTPDKHKYRSPSPVMQVSSISPIVSGGTGFRSTSPVNQMPAFGTTQQLVPTKAYIHPLTGQKLQYGNQFGQSIPNVSHVVPLVGQVPGIAQRVVPVIGQRPGIAEIPRTPVPMVSNPAILQSGVIQRPPFVIVGPVSPVGLSPQMVSPVQTQPPGMAIQTIGSMPDTKGPRNERKSSSDVFDWFSDKFEKRDKNDKGAFSPVENTDVNLSSVANVPVTTKPNYQFSQNSANKVIKTVPESNLRQIDRSFNVEEKGSDRKRPADFSDESGSEPKKQVRIAIDSKSSRPVPYKGNLISISTTQTLTEAKKTLENPSESKSSAESKETTDTGASSELEDGEISDDSDDDPLIVQQQPGNRCAIKESNSAIPVIGSRSEPYPGQGHRIQTIGSATQESPRIVNIKSDQSRYIPSLQNRGVGISQRVGAEWSNILQNPAVKAIEVVNAPKIKTMSATGKDQEDTSMLLSKSAASISKAKQKIMARSQVKTLGDWLKLELETDNIQPLQSIIPYSLNTDLTIIPKPRRRKIRLKVKNAIEMEGLKKLKIEAKQQQHPQQYPQQPPQQPLQQPPQQPLQQPPQQPSSSGSDLYTNYAAEVDHSQTEKELSIVSRAITELKSSRDRNVTGETDFNLLFALTSVENEMKILLQRTNFYGYPHRRVPSELLLESEKQSFRSQQTEVFLILMMPISTKPYHKLLQIRHDLEELSLEIQTAADKESAQRLIDQLHAQRQATLRSFTGYLNKRRIQKVQDNVDKYTKVYEYFKHQQPPVPDSLLKFIRTTQMDLRQHLILAKQYHAMDEAKVVFK